MQLNLRIPVVNRKGLPYPSAIDANGNPSGPPLMLSDVVANQLEACPDKTVPTRKYMNWLVQIDQTGGVELSRDELMLFLQAVDATSLIPAAKIQVLQLVDVLTNPLSATVQPQSPAAAPAPVSITAEPAAPAVAASLPTFPPRDL